MREFRTSGSVGAAGGNSRGHPTALLQPVVRRGRAGKGPRVAPAQFARPQCCFPAQGSGRGSDAGGEGSRARTDAFDTARGGERSPASGICERSRRPRAAGEAHVRRATSVRICLSRLNAGDMALGLGISGGRRMGASCPVIKSGKARPMGGARRGRNPGRPSPQLPALYRRHEGSDACSCAAHRLRLYCGYEDCSVSSRRRVRPRGGVGQAPEAEPQPAVQSGSRGVCVQACAGGGHRRSESSVRRACRRT